MALSLALPRRRLYYEEMVGRAKEREAEEEARRRRARDKLASYLRHARGLKDGTLSWSEFLEGHGKEPEVKAVSEGRVGGGGGRDKLHMLCAVARAAASPLRNMLGWAASVPALQR